MMAPACWRFTPTQRPRYSITRSSRPAPVTTSIDTWPGPTFSTRFTNSHCAETGRHYAASVTRRRTGSTRRNITASIVSARTSRTRWIISSTLVVGRRAQKFSQAELAYLALIEPIVRAGMQRVWDKWRSASARSAPDKSIHRRLTEVFENFGDGVLTRREREITQLLLRGHSSKSVARKLDIAPGTVMVHKRNLFSKLGITSQFELFSLFISKLSAS